MGAVKFATHYNVSGVTYCYRTDPPNKRKKKCIAYGEKVKNKIIFRGFKREINGNFKGGELWEVYFRSRIKIKF